MNFKQKNDKFLMFEAPKSNEIAPNKWSLEFYFEPKNFAYYAYRLLLAYCVGASLSIAWAQIVIYPLLAYFLAFLFFNRPLVISLIKEDSHLGQFLGAISVFLFFSAIACAIGVAPLKSLQEFSLSCVLALLPLCIYVTLLFSPTNSLYRRSKFLLICLFFSQALASLHTILSTSLGKELKPGIPGAVTEAGQLALLIPLCVAVTVSTSKGRALSAILSISLIACAWYSNLGVSSPLVFLGAALLCAFLLRALEGRTYHLVVLALLFTSLILNLKRGPWLGVFTSLVTFGLFYSRRLAVLTIASAVLIFTLVAPVRNRILDYSRDFSIAGGRETMWSIGVELSARFPLGLGLGNARQMRLIDPDLPDTHQHLHNNLLNLFVETGVLGALSFVWWMWIVLFIAYSSWRHYRLLNPEVSILSFGLLLSILSWQIAGLVEYNYGDGEIRFLAFFLMGLIISHSKFSEQQQTNSKEK